jgi:hypothetical protein
MSFTAKKSSGTTAVRVLTIPVTPEAELEALRTRVAAHENALPVIIDSLANPTAHDANAADVFDVMIPSIPGYGYSGKHRKPAGAEAALPSDRRQAR